MVGRGGGGRGRERESRVGGPKWCVERSRSRVCV